MKKCIVVLLLSCLLFSCEKEEEVKPVTTEEKEVVYNSHKGLWKAQKKYIYNGETTYDIDLKAFVFEDYVLMGEDTLEYYIVDKNRLHVDNGVWFVYRVDSLSLYRDQSVITFVR